MSNTFSWTNFELNHKLDKDDDDNDDAGEGNIFIYAPNWAPLTWSKRYLQKRFSPIISKAFSTRVVCRLAFSVCRARHSARFSSLFCFWPA